MLRSILLDLSEREAPRKLISSTSAGRRMAARFIAGERLDDAMGVVRGLNAEGFDVTLDHLGESVRDVAQAETAAEAYLAILDRLAVERLRAHISVKLTQLGLVIDRELARQRLSRIVDRAAALGSFVRIDMEGSACTEATLSLFHSLQAPGNALGVVIQAYLYRSERDVQELLAMGSRIRLVKGAYREPPEIAFPREVDVDRNFVRLTKMLLASGGDHAIATHDLHMIEATKSFARELGLGPERFEFQMLYGIRRKLQRQLRQQGYRVRVYVPYGSQWYSYFMRRLAERPANLLFLMRNLFRE